MIYKKIKTEHLIFINLFTNFNYDFRFIIIFIKLENQFLDILYLNLTSYSFVILNIVLILF